MSIPFSCLIDLNNFVNYITYKNNFRTIYFGQDKTNKQISYLFKSFNLKRDSKTQKLFAYYFNNISEEISQEILNYQYLSFIDFVSQPKPTIGLRLVSNITLEKVMNEKNKIFSDWNIEDSMNCLFSVAVGMSKLHAKMKLHGNLCPSNIIIDKAKQAYICDFGLYKIKEMFNPNSRIIDENYADPQLICYNPTFQTDVYSYGILLFNLIYNYFLNDENLKINVKNILNSDDKTIINKLPTTFQTLFYNCVDSDYTKRISFDGIIKIFQDSSFIIHKQSISNLFTKYAESNYIQNLANSNDSYALNKLGDYYFNKLKDTKMALNMYLRSAQKENREAQANYGYLLIHCNKLNLRYLGKNNIDQAINFLNKSILEKNGYALYLYGLAMIDLNKYSEAEKHLKMSHDAGFSKSTFELGKLFLKNKKSIRNLSEGASYIKCAADENNPDAIYQYGMCLKKGIGVLKNINESVKYFQLASQLGNQDATYEYAKYLFKHSTSPDEKENSINLLKKSAQQGFRKAQARLDKIVSVENQNNSNNATQPSIKPKEYIIDKYNSIKEDFLQGISQQLVEYENDFISMGNATIIKEFAELYEEGKRVKLDIDRALRYYQMAANLGDSDAQLKYGLYLQKGNHCKLDLNESFILFKKSAEQENINGIYQYGLSLYNGKGTNANIPLGLQYLKKAADKGLIIAKLKYGIHLIKKSTPSNLQNVNESKKYINQAIHSDDPKYKYIYAKFLQKSGYLNESINLFINLVLNHHYKKAINNCINLLNSSLQNTPVYSHNVIKMFKSLSGKEGKDFHEIALKIQKQLMDFNNHQDAIKFQANSSEIPEIESSKLSLEKELNKEEINSSKKKENGESEPNIKNKLTEEINKGKVENNQQIQDKNNFQNQQKHEQSALNFDGDGKETELNEKELKKLENPKIRMVLKDLGDPSKTNQIYNLALKGDTNAIGDLADLLYNAVDTQSLAADIYEIAAKRENPTVLLKYANLLYNNGFYNKKSSISYKYFKILSEKFNNGEASYKIGMMLKNGKISRAIKGKPLEYFKKADQQGYIPSKLQLAKYYQKGEQKDLSKYRRLLESIVNTNFSQLNNDGSGISEDLIGTTFYRLGKSYKNVNQEKMEHFFKKAADKGNQSAKQALQKIHSRTDNIEDYGIEIGSPLYNIFNDIGISHLIDESSDEIINIGKEFFHSEKKNTDKKQLLRDCFVFITIAINDQNPLPFIKLGQLFLNHKHLNSVIKLFKYGFSLKINGLSSEFGKLIFSYYEKNSNNFEFYQTSQLNECARLLENNKEPIYALRIYKINNNFKDYDNCLALSIKHLNDFDLNTQINLAKICEDYNISNLESLILWKKKAYKIYKNIFSKFNYKEASEKMQSLSLTIVEEMEKSSYPNIINSLGVTYFKGKYNQQVNYTKAFSCFTKAMKFNNLKALVNVAKCYINGYGTEKDVSQGEDCLISAILKDDIKAKYLYAKYSLNGLIEVDQTSSMEYLKEAADAGMIKAIIAYGIYTKDYMEGIRYLKKAADSENAKGQYEYAKALIDIKINENQSLIESIRKELELNIDSEFQKYMEISALNGYPKAIQFIYDNYFKRFSDERYNELSLIDDPNLFFSNFVNEKDILMMKCYSNQLIENGDIQKARSILKAMADFGDIDSMYNYAQELITDNYSDKNEIIKYLQPVADQGNATAACQMAQFFSRGEGVKEDQNMAKHYFDIALEHSDNSNSLQIKVAYSRWSKSMNNIKNESSM